MAGVDRAEEGEGLRSPHLADEEAVGSHAQRRLEQGLDRDVRRALIAAGGEQMHRVLLRRE